MKALSTLIASLLAALLSGCNPAQPPQGEALALIDEGKGYAEIVLPDSSTAMEEEAAELLQHYLEKATGVALPLRRETAVPLSPGAVELHVGQTRALKARGIDLETLPPESYGVRTEGKVVFFYGHDREQGRSLVARPNAPDNPEHWSAYRTPATRWAVNHFAENTLGVRWLWPGETGTYIPRTETVRLEPLAVEQRPRLERRFYMAKGRLVAHSSSAASYLVPTDVQDRLRKEARHWMEDHLAGNRSSLYYGHSFSHWWERYAENQPELFAQPPSPEFSQPFPKPDRVKLRISNPAVIDLIEQEYLAAGKPDTWPVTPNDGSGFDTSLETRAWDRPADQDPLEIWRARGQLTARYVEFWNRVYERLSRHRPDVRLSTLAYSSYRQPPPSDLRLTAKLAIGVVNGYKTPSAYEAWSGWADRGAELILRPNWWHVGVHAPYLEPYAQGKYLKFAAANGMVAFTGDSLMGYWATQGLNYYLAARLLNHPDMEVDAIIEEYTSAFGAAAPQIRRYLDYWFDYSGEVNFEAAALASVGGVPEGTKSLYLEMAQKHGFSGSVLTGSFRAIPLLYEDDRLEPAAQILKEAYAVAEQSGDVDATARVRFLQEGLEEFRATRDLLKLGYRLQRGRERELLPLFKEKAQALRALRTRLTLEHAVWGEAIYVNEIRRRVPTSPAALPDLEEIMDGL